MISFGLLLLSTVTPVPNQEACPLVGGDQAILQALKKRAEKGNKQAQYCLGFAYEHGDTVPQDDEVALKWYRRAAQRIPVWKNTYLPPVGKDGRPRIRTRIVGYTSGIAGSKEGSERLAQKISKRKQQSATITATFCLPNRLIDLSATPSPGKLSITALCASSDGNPIEQIKTFPIDPRLGQLAPIQSIYWERYSKEKKFEVKESNNPKNDNIKNIQVINVFDGSICLKVSFDMRQKGSLPWRYTDKYGGWAKALDILVDLNCKISISHMGNQVDINYLEGTRKLNFYGLSFNLKAGDGE